MTLITTNTPSAAAASSFTSSIDSTYKLFIFKFIDIHNETDNNAIAFQGSTNGGTDWGVTMTTSFFRASHSTGDGTALTYQTGFDIAQGTGYQPLAKEAGGDEADETCAGTLFLFNPSNTTYVKHFYSVFNNHQADDETNQCFVGGYFNTTSAINAIDIRVVRSLSLTGDDFSGTIKMYGVG